MAYPHHRGRLDRATDEVRSWFGDENAEHRRAMDERRTEAMGRRRWPNRDDYRYAGETILGRADWGDRESDYEHGFGAFRVSAGSEQPAAPDYTGRGPRGYRRSDERIFEDVCDRLTDDPSVDASAVDVRVEKGYVTLAGNVDSRSEKRRAEDDAAMTAGVKDVINELRITPDLVPS